MAKPFEILVLNQISANGLKRLPAESYIVGKAAPAPAPTTSRSSS